MYYFYILRCSDNSLYSGIAKDVKKRLREHNSKGGRGAKYTRAKGPVNLVYTEEYIDVKEAMRRERQVKKMRKSEKENLIMKSAIIRE